MYKGLKIHCKIEPLIGQTLKNLRMNFIKRKFYHNTKLKNVGEGHTLLKIESELFGKAKMAILPGEEKILNNFFCSSSLNTIFKKCIDSWTATVPVNAKNNQKDKYFSLEKSLERSRIRVQNPYAQTSFSLFQHHSSSLWYNFRPNHFVYYSTNSDKVEASDKKDQNPPSLTVRQKLKTMMKEYGPAVLVIHITLSLISLMTCYLILASGAAQSGIFKGLGIDEGASTASVAATVVVAYAVHKSLAPWRIGLTLFLAPFIVKKLRLMGYLKVINSKKA